MLLDLQSDTIEQHELDFEELGNSEMGTAHDRTRLMLTLDSINFRNGRGTVLLASAGLAGDRREWAMKQERRTPGNTTCWEDMAVARS